LCCHHDVKPGTGGAFYLRGERRYVHVRNASPSPGGESHQRGYLPPAELSNFARLLCGRILVVGDCGIPPECDSSLSTLLPDRWTAASYYLGGEPRRVYEISACTHTVITKRLIEVVVVKLSVQFLCLFRLISGGSFPSVRCSSLTRG
jgi:hypothetical protein